MLVITLSLAVAIAATATSASLEYVVLHRTGPAGEMRVVTRGDTVLVPGEAQGFGRLCYTERNPYGSQNRP